MTNEQINIAIAEACGLDVIQNPRGPKDRPEAWKTGFFTPKAAKQRRLSWPSSDVVKVIPDYCNDLNEIHQLTMTLGDQQLCEMADYLHQITGFHTRIFHATARERAEAFLRTIGKWEDEK